MIVDLKTLSPTAVYHLMTQTVIPRPIAWVLTRNKDGKSHNLAPYSYFNAVSSDPPLLMISCAPKPDDDVKDTVKNAIREEKLVIHIAHDGQLQAVQDTAAPLCYGESELDLSHLPLCDFAGSKRLAESPIAFACRLFSSQSLGNAPQTLLFAEIEHVYIADQAVTQNDKRIVVDALSLAPLARLGQNQFATLGSLQRPQTNQ